MTDPLTNLLRILDTDCLADAHEDAREQAANGNAAAILAYETLRERVEDGDTSCGCSECGNWDGRSHRCSCGNRRVYWEYQPPCEWSPNGYFVAECY